MAPATPATSEEPQVDIFHQGPSLATLQNTYAQLEAALGADAEETKALKCRVDSEKQRLQEKAPKHMQLQKMERKLAAIELKLGTHEHDCDSGDLEKVKKAGRDLLTQQKELSMARTALLESMVQAPATPTPTLQGQELMQMLGVHTVAHFQNLEPLFLQLQQILDQIKASAAEGGATNSTTTPKARENPAARPSPTRASPSKSRSPRRTEQGQEHMDVAANLGLEGEAAATHDAERAARMEATKKARV